MASVLMSFGKSARKTTRRGSRVVRITLCCCDALEGLSRPLIRNESLLRTGTDNLSGLNVPQTTRLATRLHAGRSANVSRTMRMPSASPAQTGDRSEDRRLLCAELDES
jgi:hypothetical protein